MPLQLNAIPGFADINDSNFAAEQYAVGLNFQRILDNTKLGIVRPEVFVGRYINGETVLLPTSPVDGYTYSRDELRYIWHFGLTGGTSSANNGAPSAAGALRYIGAIVDPNSGAVTTSVEYLVANGSAPTVTHDGTVEVFTVATRALTSLVVATSPVYTAIADSESAIDAPVTESLMQRMNRNAKFAALSSEIIYMGEFVDGDTIPRPLSPADGYLYTYGEVQMLACWRWTTPGGAFLDPADPNHKQIRDISYTINPTTGLLNTVVTYYNSGNYVSNDGRMEVFAFCTRNFTIGAGTVDFIDISLDFLASGVPDRFDVMAVAVKNMRYAALRPEFFSGSYTNGQTVALPTSTQDGYVYSREELTYVYGYIDTGSPSSNIRIGSWNCTIDQSTGVVTSQITRVQDGGGFVPTTDGHLRVITIARRDHVAYATNQYIYDGSGGGGYDNTALQNGGFDNWYKTTDQAADQWFVNQQSGTGYGAQSTGLVSGFSQRLGTTSATGLISVMSGSVNISSGDLRFFSWVEKPSGTSSSATSAITSIAVNSYTRPGPGGHATTVYPSFTVDYTTPITMSPGDTIIIAGNTEPTFNGTWTVAAVNSTTEITVNQTFTSSLTGTGGTLTHETAPSGVGTVTVIFHFYDAVGDECSATLITETPVGGANQRNIWLQIPTMGDTAVITISGVVSITGTLDFVPTVVRIEFVYTAGTAAAYIDLDEVTFISQVNPSIGQIAQRGSDSLSFFPAITFMVDDTTFTPDLDFYVNRTDGSTTTIVGGSPTATGLSASTTYFWYPYLNEITGIVGNVGENGEISTAGVGSPPWLQPTATREAYSSWYGMSHLPFAASPIQVTTTAPTAPPTGGSGGGGGRCFRKDTWVLVFPGIPIQVKNLVVGDFIAGEANSWLEVLSLKHTLWSKWANFKFNHGGGIDVVTHHLMLTVQDDGAGSIVSGVDDSFNLLRAWDCTMSTQMQWTKGVCHPVSFEYVEKEDTMVTIGLEHPHRFYAGSDPYKLTLMTARLSIRQCGCKGEV
jgi:hypothetical protein